MDHSLRFIQHLLCILGTILTLNAVASNGLNDNPVVGILSQSTHGEMAKYGKSYIAASYVKFVESAGARVVPILMNQPDSYYKKMFSSLNGVLFPGGGQEPLLESQYGRAGRFFYELAIKNHDEHGIYFPIWGTCLGMELLVCLTAKKDVLGSTDALDFTLPIILTEGFNNSRLFHGADKFILETLTTKNVTYNNHHSGLTPTNFTKYSALSSFYQVMSTNFDKKGVTFISSMEAKNYPIYAVQFHPEKDPFEWKSKNIDHSAEGVAVTQFFADFFIGEARRNDQAFLPGTLESHLIYNYAPVYCADKTPFQQCYYFNV